MTTELNNLESIRKWLRNICSDFDVIGFATKRGKTLPLNLESGTLGNVIESFGL